MEEEKVDLLLDDLFEVKSFFDNTIKEMKENGIDYSYDEIITGVEANYSMAFNAISRLKGYMEEYNLLMESNADFFEQEISIYAKYAILYVASIIIIKIFAKTLSAKEISEIWFAIIGLVLGSVNMGIIHKNVNNHLYGTKESRELMDKISTLKENYKEDYAMAYKAIEQISKELNKLWKDLDKSKEKEYIKK